MTDSPSAESLGGPTAAVHRARQWWRGLSRPQRALVSLSTVIVGIRLLIAGLLTVSGGQGPGGPESSSFATAPTGLAAYADLLAAHGHRIVQSRQRLDKASLDPSSTVVVIDPDTIDSRELSALRTFLSGGGRLLLGGRSASDAVAALVAPEPSWDAGATGPLLSVAAPAEGVGIDSVETDGFGSWIHAGAGLPVLEGRKRAATIQAGVGRGTLIALADASLLHNAHLAHRDNAAFALAIAGEDSRVVLFDEAAHGYGPAAGLRAIPPRWQLTMLILFGAILSWMWAAGRRLGPPELDSRPLPPPRQLYVDSLAATLARTKDPDAAVRPIRQQIRARLSSRAVLAHDATAEAIREAAIRQGLEPGDVAALLRPVQDDADVLAVGRMLATLEERPW